MKRILFVLIVSLFSASFSFAATEIEIMTLLTKEEGGIEEAPSGLYEIGKALNDGPDIKVVKPETQEKYRSPIRIIILFLSKNGKKVDLSKLRVECLKLLTIDLTERVLPYTTEEGIKIENAKFPAGHHKIRITVGDVEGGVTQEIFLANILE
jgi:hypothetical protein